MGKAVDALCHSDLFFNEKGGEKKINHIMKWCALSFSLNPFKVY
jgi:hypothetical protein